MKKFGLIVAAVIGMSITVVSCDGGKLKQAQQENQQLIDSIAIERAAQDSLLSILNEVTSGMNQIKEMEKIINSANFDRETASQKDAIKNDIILLSQVLQERRQKIEQLEKKLKDSGAYSAKMQETIKSLKAQISEQAEEISTLQESLQKANEEIAVLNLKVENLNTTVDSVTDVKNKAEAETVRIANQLNTCYYVIGSNKELKENNIIEKKFLGKTKVMESDYELSYFTKADKRTLTALPIHSKKAKILTKQPADSYTFVEENGSKVLQIKDAAKFWELSNFLVIEVD